MFSVSSWLALTGGMLSRVSGAAGLANSPPHIITGEKTTATTVATDGLHGRQHNPRLLTAEEAFEDDHFAA